MKGATTELRMSSSATSGLPREHSARRQWAKLRLFSAPGVLLALLLLPIVLSAVGEGPVAAVSEKISTISILAALSNSSLV